MAQDRPGISQIIFKATGGTFSADVTIDGHQLSRDTQVVLEEITTGTAKGGIRHNNNNQFDFEIQCYDYSVLSSLRDHKNEWGDLEIYELGDTVTPIMTLNEVNPMINEQAQFDPSDESGQFFTIGIQGVNTI